ncbi:unnamed protein product [Closterium sp. NIES-64]|nr:unnamed protein product [Closterium sp. NIES-64]
MKSLGRRNEKEDIRQQREENDELRQRVEQAEGRADEECLRAVKEARRAADALDEAARERERAEDYCARVKRLEREVAVLQTRVQEDQRRDAEGHRAEGEGRLDAGRTESDETKRQAYVDGDMLGKGQGDEHDSEQVGGRSGSSSPTSGSESSSSDDGATSESSRGSDSDSEAVSCSKSGTDRAGDGEESESDEGDSDSRKIDRHRNDSDDESRGEGKEKAGEEKEEEVEIDVEGLEANGSDERSQGNETTPQATFASEEKEIELRDELGDLELIELGGWSDGEGEVEAGSGGGKVEDATGGEQSQIGACESRGRVGLTGMLEGAEETMAMPTRKGEFCEDGGEREAAVRDVKEDDQSRECSEAPAPVAPALDCARADPTGATAAAIGEHTGTVQRVTAETPDPVVMGSSNNGYGTAGADEGRREEGNVPEGGLDGARGRKRKDGGGSDGASLAHAQAAVRAPMVGHGAARAQRAVMSTVVEEPPLDDVRAFFASLCFPVACSPPAAPSPPSLTACEELIRSNNGQMEQQPPPVQQTLNGCTRPAVSALAPLPLGPLPALLHLPSPHHLRAPPVRALVGPGHIAPCRDDRVGPLSLPHESHTPSSTHGSCTAIVTATATATLIATTAVAGAAAPAAAASAAVRANAGAGVKGGTDVTASGGSSTAGSMPPPHAVCAFAPPSGSSHSLSTTQPPPLAVPASPSSVAGASASLRDASASHGCCNEQMQAGAGGIPIEAEMGGGKRGLEGWAEGDGDAERDMEAEKEARGSSCGEGAAVLLDHLAALGDLGDGGAGRGRGSGKRDAGRGKAGERGQGGGRGRRGGGVGRGSGLERRASGKKGQWWVDVGMAAEGQDGREGSAARAAAAPSRGLLPSSASLPAAIYLTPRSSSSVSAFEIANPLVPLLPNATAPTPPIPPSAPPPVPALVGVPGAGAGVGAGRAAGGVGAGAAAAAAAAAGANVGAGASAGIARARSSGGGQLVVAPGVAAAVAVMQVERRVRERQQRVLRRMRRGSKRRGESMGRNSGAVRGVLGAAGRGETGYGDAGASAFSQALLARSKSAGALSITAPTAALAQPSPATATAPAAAAAASAAAVGGGAAAFGTPALPSAGSCPESSAATLPPSLPPSASTSLTPVCAPPHASERGPMSVAEALAAAKAIQRERQALGQGGAATGAGARAAQGRGGAGGSMVRGSGSGVGVCGVSSEQRGGEQRRGRVRGEAVWSGLDVLRCSAVPAETPHSSTLTALNRSSMRAVNWRRHAANGAGTGAVRGDAGCWDGRDGYCSDGGMMRQGRGEANKAGWAVGDVFRRGGASGDGREDDGPCPLPLLLLAAACPVWQRDAVSTTAAAGSITAASIR